MILCTECYLQEAGKTLMLYRNKKKNDINKNKWIGLGGKFEPGESPEECLVREIKEEAGVTLTGYRLRGILTFLAGEADQPYCIFIYTAHGYEGTVNPVCAEGELKWVDTAKIEELELWEGDRLFWSWLKADRGFFSAKFTYQGDVLTNHQVQFYNYPEIP